MRTATLGFGKTWRSLRNIWESKSIKTKFNSMKFSITIFSETQEFSQALEYIRKQTEEGFIRGFDSNDDESFQYSIEEEE